MSDDRPEIIVNWRLGIIQKYESLWSILHKFAYLNRVKASDIKRLFDTKSHMKGLVSWGDLPGYLLNPGRIDEDKLCRVLNTSHDIIKYSTIKPYTLSLNYSVYKTLRFCTICTKKSFHSPLFQHSHVTHCPIHGEKLINNCPSCGNTIPYSLSTKSFSTYYGCECGFPLANNLDNVLKPAVASSISTENINLFFQWKSKLNESINKSNNIEILQSGGKSYIIEYCLSDILSLNEYKIWYRSNEYIYSIIPRKYIPYHTKVSMTYDEATHIIAIFKSIKRYLFNKVICNHSHHVSINPKNNFVNDELLFYQCPDLYALYKWECLWYCRERCEELNINNINFTYESMYRLENRLPRLFIWWMQDKHYYSNKEYHHDFDVLIRNLFSSVIESFKNIYYQVRYAIEKGLPSPFYDQNYPYYEFKQYIQSQDFSGTFIIEYNKDQQSVLIHLWVNNIERSLNNIACVSKKIVHKKSTIKELEDRYIEEKIRPLQKFWESQNRS